MKKKKKTPEENKTTEKKSVAKKKAESSAEVKTSKPASSTAGLYIFVFIVAIASCGGFYLLWQKLQQNSIKLQIASQKTDQKIANVNQQQLEFSKKNALQIKEIQTDQENLLHNLTNLIQNNKQLRKDWLMAEAEYLIQLANYRLLLEKDVTTAAVALKAADTRLAEMADPAIFKIREILAKDLQTLNNIPKIDLAGLSVTISAMSKNISNLPLNTPDPKTYKTNQEQKTQATAKVESLKDLPAAIWQDFKSLIVIRHHQKAIEPLLAPGQHFFLVQNLALLLEQARLALLNGDNVIYQERLQTSATWIKQYFDNEHNITRNMLAKITELQKYDIDPTLPDISSTYSIIQKYRLHGQQPGPPAAKVKE